MKNFQLKKLLSIFIIFLAIALYLVYFINTLVIKKGETLAVIGFSLLGIVVTFISSFILHELGHIIFGLCCRLKLCYVKVLGVRIGKNANNKTSITFEKDGVFSSETVFYPSSGEGVSVKIGLTALGGPIFSFLQTVAQLIVALTLINNTAVFCVLGISFVIPLYLFVINVIPFSYSYDGSLAFTMLSGGKKSLIASAYITAESLVSSGVTPDKLNQRLLSVYDANYDFYSVRIIRLRYLSYLIDDEDSAFKELDKISNVNYLPDGTYGDVVYELFFRAIVQGNDEYVSNVREEVLFYLDEDDSPTSFRVQVALAVYDGELERAKLLCQSGIKICENYGNVGLAEFEKQILQRFYESL